MNRFHFLWASLLCLRLQTGTVESADTASERFFGLTNLWEIRLTLTAAHWAALEPQERMNNGPRPPGPGTFDRDYPWSTATFECAGQVLTNVAVRFKGNSSFNMSRNGLKRPFKLDFDRGAEKRTFLGHEELLLNNNFNDGTQFREALAYEVFRRAGVAAPRTAFARVFLTIPGERTNTFLGLYTVAEAVEGDFLKANFGSKKGLLVKPERLPGLRFLGPDWTAYTNRYEPKTDVTATDTERFIAFTRMLDEADDATFAREIPRQLNLTNLLRLVAVNAVLANYDSLIGTGHNFYLFQPRDGKPAVFIPWDLNESFGGHPGAGGRREQAEFSVLRPNSDTIRFLSRVLAHPAFAEAYRQEVAALLTHAFNPVRLRADAAQLAQLIQESVFAESPEARTAFEVSALGRTNLLMRLNPGPSRGGPGFGPRPDDFPFAAWVDLRAKNVAAEVAGERTGAKPRMQRGPGGPGRPGQPPPGTRRGEGE